MVRRLGVPEELRMPPPHLLFQRACDRLGVQRLALFADDDLEREVEQQVAELVAQGCSSVVLQGLIELEHFLDQVGAECLRRLRAVPGAAGSQVAHQREGAGEGGVGHGTLEFNPFFALHLHITARSFRAPVNASPSGRDARAWVEVDLAAVVENARTVARVAGTRLLPVVKANAYGVGAVAVSQALEALDPWGYGVATIEEGAELRAAGITRPVLVFTPARNDLFDGYREQRLTPALGDGRTVADWIARGARGGAFHLEIDTGMGRSGVRWDEVEPLADLLDTPYLEGCYTQFHSAERNDGSAEQQLERFRLAVGRLARRPALLHVANSAAALKGGSFAFDAVRPGVYLYGGSPGVGLPEGKPVVSVRARVVAVRRVRAGDSVSYNASWTAARDTTIATLGIGYADGLRRSLGASGRAQVLLRGRPCPIIGLVTMDLTMLDVGDGPATVGDVATLVGSADGGGGAITLEQFAAWSGELQREFLTGLGPRLPRIYR
ncbi:MAG: alanine racemase [Gemmatimonadetes bacterium]|nr:MAG: alanine racemase [Gemmatimonadota bacterium]PYP25172.1 MAG: alanine racemase [Gemmatimonadota bacterium]